MLPHESEDDKTLWRKYVQIFPMPVIRALQRDGRGENRADKPRLRGRFQYGFCDLSVPGLTAVDNDQAPGLKAQGYLPINRN